MVGRCAKIPLGLQSIGGGDLWPAQEEAAYALFR